MKMLISKDEFNQLKSRELILLECHHCSKQFYKSKSSVQMGLKKTSGHTCKFCSHGCSSKHKTTRKLVECFQCKKKFERELNRIKNKNFCNHSCSSRYTNTHKTKGNRRSKLEYWLENRLNKKFSQLEIFYNKKDTIDSELDIYIPSLSIAFELNGIFHYEPIYGEKKLNQIKNNDYRKFQACIEKDIELCMIDVSSQKYFKEKSSEKFLDIIIDLIEKKVDSTVGFIPT